MLGDAPTPESRALSPLGTIRGVPPIDPNPLPPGSGGSGSIRLFEALSCLGSGATAPCARGRATDRLAIGSVKKCKVGTLSGARATLNQVYWLVAKHK